MTRGWAGPFRLSLLGIWNWAMNGASGSAAVDAAGRGGGGGSEIEAAILSG